MKIAIDARELKNDRSTGIGRFLKNFLDGVTEEKKRDFYLLGDKSSNLSLYASAAHILDISSVLTLWSDQLVIPAALKKQGVEVFFSPYYKMPLWLNTKRVVTIHDLHFLNSMLRKGAGRFKPFVSYLRLVASFADKIITVSEFSKKEIIRLLGADEKKIRVVYNAVHHRFVRIDAALREAFDRKFRVNSEYLLYVGNMMPHKNLKGLLEAYNLLDDNLKSRYKLVFVAKKDENFAALEQFVTSHDLEDNVIFIDFVSDDDLVLFYNFAALFVFPSFYEGFGLPPLEAMACGSCVVSSGETSLKEVLGDNAVYIDPYSVKSITAGIAGVLNNNGLRQSLSECGIKHAKSFDPVIFSHQLLKEIESA